MLKYPFWFAIPVMAALAAMGGCSSEPTCDYSDAPYVAARSVPPLKAPAGLSAPDRSASLTIPDIGPNAKPIPTGKGRCLDSPPSYFATGDTRASDAAKQ